MEAPEKEERWPAVVRDVSTTGFGLLIGRPQEPDDRVPALHFLSRALRSGFGFEHLDTDRDLDALRDRPEFKQLVESARRLGSP